MKHLSLFSLCARGDELCTEKYYLIIQSIIHPDMKSLISAT